jgi:membrane protease YdiL (CAAX protease family)
MRNRYDGAMSLNKKVATTGARHLQSAQQSRIFDAERRNIVNTPPTRIRYPMTWEASLLVAGLLTMVLVLSAGAAALGLPVIPILSFQLLIIVPGLLWLAIRRLPLRATLRLHPIGWRMALWSALIGLVCWPAVAGMACLFDWMLSLIGPGPEFPWPTGLLESAVYALVFIVLAPITEEPIFRGFVLGAWLRRGTVPGLVLAGFLFALLHAQIALLVPLTLLGIALGLLAHRSGSIYSSVIAHACYNTIATVFVVIPPLRESPDWIFVAAGAIATPLAVLLLWVFARRYPGSTAEMPPREGFSWGWSALSLLVPLGVFGLTALLELVLRLSPDLAGM